MHIKLDDPTGSYAASPFKAGDVTKISGRIGSLAVPRGDTDFVLDASNLVAKVVDLGPIQGQSDVTVNAPDGSVSTGGATDQAILAINAPNGNVTFVGGVSRGARVTVTAKEVDFQVPMWDEQATVVITLSKGGKLKLQDLYAGHIYYHRADPADPEPTVEVGRILNGNVHVRELKGKEPGYSFDRISSLGAVTVDCQGGEVLIGSILGCSTATINVPNGMVTIGTINDAKLMIAAREVYISQDVAGRKTRVMVTLSKGGTLKATRVSEGQLYYCKAAASDPEITVEVGRVAPGSADVRRLTEGT